MKCKVCGNQTKDGRTHYCSEECRDIGVYTHGTCVNCGKTFKFKRSKKTQSYCSKSCAMKDRDYDRLGSKQKETLLDRYGVTHPLHASQFKEKQKQTNMERYGVVNPAKSRQVKDKISKVRKRNDYNRLLSMWDGLFIPLFTLDDFENGDRDTEYKFTCLKCSNDFSGFVRDGILPRCHVCNPILYHSSRFQESVKDFIASITDLPIETNTKKYIPPKELDIVIPDLNIAIECNGVYWHSELAGKDKSYHLRKTQRCQENGIRLFHIFEPEWEYKRPIVESIIRHAVNYNTERLYARNLYVDNISVDEARDFLNKNHLQGYSPAKFYLGLRGNGGALYALLTIGKSRYDKKFEYEILRFAVKLNTNVVGGLSKLFAYFVRTECPESVLSYVDRRYFIGEGYQRVGFNYFGSTPPKYHYFTKGSIELLSRERFQKHKLKDELDIYRHDLSEWENMQLNGFNRIWDCGNYKMVWKR